MCAWLTSQEHVSIFGPQQFVKSTVMSDVSALFGAADVARPRDVSSFVAQCLEEPGSLAMNTKAGTNAVAEQHLTKLQARYRGHLSRTGRSHLVPETGVDGPSADGLPPFDTVQYLNAQVRPMLVDALVKVGRDRPKQPSKTFAAAVATAAQ